MLNAGCFLVSVSPYLMSCPIPSSHANLTPVSVSLVEEMCETSTNYLNIIYNLPSGEKEKFAVCVKGLDFPMEDLSLRLVEWIEVLKALGAAKVFLYSLDVHPNVRRVVEHYTSRGEVELIPLSLPEHQPNLPGLQHLYMRKHLDSKRQNEEDYMFIRAQPANWTYMDTRNTTHPKLLVKIYE